MARVRMKFCGMRSAADVEAAVLAGADAVGFNFVPGSPRYLLPDEAPAVAARTPLWVDRVALFVGARVEEIRTLTDRCEIGTVQLYPPFDAEQLRALRGLRVILAVPTQRGETRALLSGLTPLAAAVLLDASPRGALPGGTGRLADWAEAAEMVVALRPLPVVLAGGLTAANVGEAIRAVGPYGVDVASGIESGPGVTDAGRMREFAQAVREAEQ